MNLFALFFTGFALGITGAMIPGPLTIFTVSESLRTNKFAGFKISAGHAVVEFLILLVLALGFRGFIESERGSDMIYAPSPDEANENLLTFGEKSFSAGQNPVFLYIAIACIIFFIILFVASVWRYRKNKTPKF